MSRPLHIVQIGWDTSILTAEAASDTRERQRRYGEILAEARPGSRHTVIVLGAPEAAEPSALDATTHVVPLAGRWRSIAKLEAVLRWLHAEHPVSVIATQTIMEDAWAAARFARRADVPLVAQVHLDPFADQVLAGRGTIRRSLADARVRLALRRLAEYAGVRVVAASIGDRLVRHGARRVWTIPVPVTDLARLSALPIEPRLPRVMFVGRLAPEKNLPLWLDVAARVSGQCPDARFDIVGGGPLRGDLESKATALGLGERITFHGPRRRDELPALYASAAVLLLTSSQEGFGRVLVEAMAGGAAVVATRTAGALEVVRDGARLLDLDDANGLAEAVVALLSRPAERYAIAVVSRSEVLQRYDPDALAQAWMDVLTRVADNTIESGPG